MTDEEPDTAGHGAGGGPEPDTEPDASPDAEPDAEDDQGPESGPLRRGLRTGRLEALSDGVFAIAITLLVLDIAVPASAEQNLLGSIGHLWPSYLGYVVSVATIGAVWLGHTAITDYLERADLGFVRLNLLLLLFVAFLPFPTRLFAEFIGEDNPERVAVTVYGVSLLLTSLLLQALWLYAARHHLVQANLADEEIELVTRRLTPGQGGYVVLIIAGLFLPIIAVIGFLGIAVYYIVPFRPLRRRRGQPLGRGRRPEVSARARRPG
jgi:uncharacterized membrane protein